MAKSRSAAVATSGTSERKGKGGRPSAFRPEYCEQAVKLCRLGATDRQIAEFFGVSEQTINAWKRAHPEFLESLKQGKEISDMAVAHSLYRKAVGYAIEVDKVVGKGDSQRVVKLKLDVEPDTTAAIFWLKNRRKEFWRDKHEVEHTGNAFRDFLAAVAGGKLKPKAFDPHEDDNV